MLTHKTAPFVLVVVGVVVFGVLGPKWPKDQTLNVVLGAAPAGADEVRIRYSEPGADTDGEWSREETFRYGGATGAGAAPRVGHHEVRLPDGEYDVEIEILDKAHVSSVARRRVSLHGGGATSVDLATQ